MTLEVNEYISTYPIQRGMETVQGIYDLVAGRGYIGGSYAAFMVAPLGAPYLPILPNDIDIFATSKQYARKIALELCDYYHMSFADETEVAYSLSPLHDEPALPIQVVKPNPAWNKFPEDIVNSFDMDICRAVLIDSQTVLADLNAGYSYGKLLRINEPLRELKRVLKYHRRGVDFNEWELLKLFRAWDQMKPGEKQVLIELYNPESTEGYEGSGDYEWDDDDYFRGE